MILYGKSEIHSYNSYSYTLHSIPFGFWQCVWFQVGSGLIVMKSSKWLGMDFI